MPQCSPSTTITKGEKEKYRTMGRVYYYLRLRQGWRVGKRKCSLKSMNVFANICPSKFWQITKKEMAGVGNLERDKGTSFTLIPSYGICFLNTSMYCLAKISIKMIISNEKQKRKSCIYIGYSQV
jgi:hypothetical protein